MEPFQVTIAHYVLSAAITACTTALGFVGVRLNRIFFVIREFPPHRHINGKRILYPEGFEPNKIQELEADRGQG